MTVRNDRQACGSLEIPVAARIAAKTFQFCGLGRLDCRAERWWRRHWFKYKRFFLQLCIVCDGSLQLENDLGVEMKFAFTAAARYAKEPVAWLEVYQWGCRPVSSPSCRLFRLGTMRPQLRSLMSKMLLPSLRIKSGNQGLSDAMTITVSLRDLQKLLRIALAGVEVDEKWYATQVPGLVEALKKGHFEWRRNTTTFTVIWKVARR